MKKLARRIGATSIIISAFLLITKLTYADSGPASIKLTDPLGGKESFTSVATSVANFLFVDVAVPLSVLMVLVGALQIMTAGGDPEKFSKGRKTITYAAIGLACAILAGGIVYLIKDFVGQ